MDNSQSVRVERLKCDHPKCGRRVRRGGQCIFHLVNKNKRDARDFERLIRRLKQTMEASAKPSIDFSGFVFPRSIDKNTFSSSEFSKHVDFSDATFQGPVDFSLCHFRGGANFRRTIFEQGALFRSTTFGSTVTFQSAMFRGEAHFTRAIFKGTASFLLASFERQAIFLEAKFGGQAHFRESTVKGNCSFAGASFDQFSGFFENVFAGGSSFYQTIFHNVVFRKTVFLGDVWLGARFRGTAEFEKVIFQRDTFGEDELNFLIRTDCLDNISTTRFDGAIVSSDGEVRFVQPMEYKPLNDNLSVPVNWGLDRVSFLNANVERFNFQDVEWGRCRGRRATIEEVLMGREGKFRGVTADQARQAYARIRRNQEMAMRYAEAGDFFIGEMEMRRKSLKERGWNGAFERFVLWLFSGLAKYGESMVRPVLWTFVFIGLFTVLRIASAEPQALTVPVLRNQTEVLSRFQTVPISWNESLLRSVAAFFQLRSPDFWTDALERMVSIPILGSLFIALKRKFERKS
jgi:uncharacterized protein YjbI with pentapeptide repeats